jgi:uncharacterized protein (TIGR02001 family)
MGIARTRSNLLNKKDNNMRKSIFKLAAVSVAMSALAVSAPAFAQEEQTAEGPITVSGSVTVVSDYRFRGVSLSDKDFAVQPTITISHESGFYVGAWASNLAENSGDDVEVDLYAGFSGGEELTYDIGATYYLYPGVSSFNYVEFTGKLGSTYGPATVGVQLSYVPSQDNTGNSDNIYFGTNAALAIPDSPITLTGSIGIEDGAFSAGDEKVDWSIGANAAIQGFTLGIAYVDSNRRSIFAANDAKAGVVFSLSYGF